MGFRVLSLLVFGWGACGFGLGLLVLVLWLGFSVGLVVVGFVGVNLVVLFWWCFVCNWVL